MLTSWRRAWNHNIAKGRYRGIFLTAALSFLVLSFGHVHADDFEMVIRAFEKDFNRVNPVEYKGRISSIIETVSGMTVHQKVKVSFQSRGDVKQAAFTEDMQKLNLEDEISLAGYEYLLKQLHLLDKDTDLKSVFLDSYLDNIYGFYRPEDKQLIIMEGASAPIATSILFHELVHAAQDATIDLTAFQKQYYQTLDATMAANSVLEGQATSFQLILQVEQNMQGRSTREILATFLERMETQPARPLDDDIDFLTRFYYFPYADGMKFVLKRYVNESLTFPAMLETIPVSSEQVLHTEKFASGEGPQTTLLEKQSAKVAAQSEVRVMFETTLGENFIREMFATILKKDRQPNEAAAAGWGGDRVMVASVNGKRFYILDTLWDTQQDAGEFYRRFREFTRARRKTTQPHSEGVFNAVFAGKHSAVRIQHSGSRVVVLEGKIAPHILPTVLQLLHVTK